MNQNRWKTLILLACGLSMQIVSPALSDELRVLTYNIRYENTRDGDDVWLNRREKVVDVIRGADIVGLQEVVASQLEYIQEHTPAFTWYGVGRDDGKLAGEMTAIGVRQSVANIKDRGTFWLSENPQDVGKKGWDAALPRVASWVHLKTASSQQDLLFMNTHYDHRGEEARWRSSELIREWVSRQRGEVPVILAGDLNATLAQRPLQMLLDKDAAQASPLLDAGAAQGIVDPGPDSTWNGFQQIQAGRRIDHILYLGDLRIKHYETLDPRTEAGRFASDHLPVKATVALD